MSNRFKALGRRVASIKAGKNYGVEKKKRKNGRFLMHPEDRALVWWHTSKSPPDPWGLGNEEEVELG
mgnify:CR=1 FL=1